MAFITCLSVIVMQQPSSEPIKKVIKFPKTKLLSLTMQPLCLSITKLAVLQLHL